MFYNSDDGFSSEDRETDSEDELDTSEFCDAHFDPDDIDYEAEQAEMAELYDGIDSDEDDEYSNSESGSEEAGEKGTKQAAGNRVRFCDFWFPIFVDKNNLRSSFLSCYEPRRRVMMGGRYSTPIMHQSQN